MLDIQRERERAGRDVREEKTVAASQHLVQTDNFTGNCTKENPWGFVPTIIVGSGAVACSKIASKYHCLTKK